MRLFLRLLFAGACLLTQKFAHSQCTNVTLNWDYLDYFTYTGNYISSAGYLTSNTLSRTQNFAFGKQQLTIVHEGFDDDEVLGENTTHTGETGSYGNGADIYFNGNGTITLTFENEVTNAKFSIYDLDRSQNVTITATNGSGSSSAVVLTEANNTNAITISGSTATSTTTSRDNDENQATINVDVAGPVKVIKLVFGGTARDFWLSDITACTVADFATDYYKVSQPFTGQPGYVLHALNKSVYAVDPATGVTKLLFTDDEDMGSSTYINSMAYDPYNKILYYVYSLTSTPGTNRKLMKYDFNTETISTVLSDISSATYGTGVNIPVVRFTSNSSNTNRGSGVESGAAAFYDGSLYLGIETNAKSSSTSINSTSGRETVIWRIDFDANKVPYRASQVFAVPIDDGSGDQLHDWSDFVIKDGILYDFDGASAASTSPEKDIYHYNLTTGTVINYHNPSGFVPGQPAVDWAGNIYNIFASALTGYVENPYLAPYNGNGNINTAQKKGLTSTPMFTPAIPSIGDAAEAFRPKADFGDAPATFDPVQLAPAVHEIDNNLRLGNNLNDEWNKASSTGADVDGYDDALPATRILWTSAGTYQTDMSYYNNTGKDATIAAWIDFNNDGSFDTGEGITQVVSSGLTQRSISLQWTGITQSATSLNNVYLRIRISTTAMTTANSTGYFSDGEVEDYLVPVDLTALPLSIIEFSVKKLNEQHVHIKWVIEDEESGTVYELQKSKDGRKWKTVDTIQGNGNSFITYTYIDSNPEKPSSFYRLKYIEPDGSIHYSETKKLDFIDDLKVKLFPNPASNKLTLWINAERDMDGRVLMFDRVAKKVLDRSVQIYEGANSISLDDILKQLVDGVYTVQLLVEGRVSYYKIIIAKQ